MRLLLLICVGKGSKECGGLLRLLGKRRCGVRLLLNVTGLRPPMQTSSALNTLACMNQCVAARLIPQPKLGCCCDHVLASNTHPPPLSLLQHPCLISSASPLLLRPCLPFYCFTSPASFPLPYPCFSAPACPPSLQHGASAHTAAQQLPQPLPHTACPTLLASHCSPTSAHPSWYLLAARCLNPRSSTAAGPTQAPWMRACSQRTR